MSLSEQENHIRVYVHIGSALHITRLVYTGRKGRTDELKCVVLQISINRVQKSLGVCRTGTATGTQDLPHLSMAGLRPSPIPRRAAIVLLSNRSSTRESWAETEFLNPVYFSANALPT